MHYKRERTAILSIINTIVISGLFVFYVYNKYLSANPDLFCETRFWALSFIKLFSVLIVTQIIIHIIFAIINKIATREDIPSKDDEMDKIISLKASGISGWITAAGIIVSIITQAAGTKSNVMIATLAITLIVSMIVSESVKIYFYKRGF